MRVFSLEESEVPAHDVSLDWALPASPLYGGEEQAGKGLSLREMDRDQ
jgi:hypothetical protein